MENEHKHVEASPEQESTRLPAMPELTKDTIETRISSELAKVVGIDTGVLEQCVAFLATMASEEVESLVKKLKHDLSEQSLPLLETMVHAEFNTLAELGIEELGTLQSFKAAQLLSEINDVHPDKKLRKAARKSLYKLRSAGIEIETSQKPLLGEAKHHRYKAMLSVIDGTGGQLIMLSQEMLAGDLHLLHVIANDQKGIEECYSRRGMTKKMFAKFPETLAHQTGMANPMLVEAEYDYAMSLALDAEQVSVETGQELPDDYVTMKAFFGLDQAQTAANPVYKILDAENLKNQPYFLRTSEDLFKHDAFLSWLLPLKETSDYAQELLDQEDSVIELSPQFQHERKEEVYHKVIQAHFGEDVVKRLHKRLEIMAYLFWLQKDEESSKRALTAALTLEGASETTLRNHPFLRKLIFESLEIAQHVIEDGYDPSELDRDDYALTRNEEGELVVQLIEKE